MSVLTRGWGRKGGAAWLRLLSGMVLVAAATGAGAQQQRVGQVDFAQGLTTAQQKDVDARFVTRGDALYEGDLISTTDKGYAVVTLTDGTRITLRPSTSFAVDRFSATKGSESAFLRLLKGGLRAVTGLVGRNNPEGFRLTTPAATIGIRGTKFDARLCAADCRQDQAENRPKAGAKAPVPAADTVIARIVRLDGAASITRTDGTTRGVLEGTPVLVGDQIVTSSKSSLVVGFRDQTRVSLEPQTVFRVDEFKYGHAAKGDHSERDNIALRLIKGGLRAFTGLIAKANPEAVQLRTASATIGIRGTGADVSCEGPCAGSTTPVSETCKAAPPPEVPAAAPGKGAKANAASAKNAKGAKGKAAPPAPVAPPPVSCLDGMVVHTWDGAITMTNAAGTIDVPLDAAGFTGADGAPRLLSSVPDFMNAFVSPRPDGVTVDWKALFAGQPYDGEDGLYTLVRDGYVFLDASAGHLDLGPGEAAVVGADGQPRRIDPVPSFLADDPFPAPEAFNPDDSLVLLLFGATMGSPGQTVCEIK